MSEIELKCPYCGSLQVEHNCLYKNHGEVMTYQYECLDCDEEFTALYTEVLFAVEKMEDGDEGE